MRCLVNPSHSGFWQVRQEQSGKDSSRVMLEGEGWGWRQQRGVGEGIPGKGDAGARASGWDSQARAGTGNHEAEGVAAGGLREVTGWVSHLPRVPLSMRAPGLSSWGRCLPPPAAGCGSPWPPASQGWRLVLPSSCFTP